MREGLTGDDRIVVSGLQRVRPGIVVAPEEKPIPPCPSPAIPPEAAPQPAAES